MLHKGPHCGDVTATIIGSNESKFCEKLSFENYGFETLKGNVVKGNVIRVSTNSWGYAESIGSLDQWNSSDSLNDIPVSGLKHI